MMFDECYGFQVPRFHHWIFTGRQLKVDFVINLAVASDFGGGNRENSG